MKYQMAAVALMSLLGASSAHSWIEEMQVISSNGSFTGDYGYMRGYMARTDPGFNGDSDTYLLPPLTSGRTRINATDLLCHPSQRTSNYSNTAYPRLQVTAGGYIAIKYLENGHVTLPQNQKGKPEGAGTVFVYSTTQPSETEYIADVLEWNSNETGGDRRGSLISAQNFDDLRCHQLNSGTISQQRQTEFPDRVAGQPTSNVEQWCETDVQIPSSQKVGDSVTLYWVWQWPTAPGADPTYPDGKDEYYTSCAEVEIVAGPIADSAPVHTLLQQDPQSTADSAWMSRTAYTTFPVETLAGSSSSYAVAAASTTASVSTSAAASSMQTSDANVATTTVYATSMVTVTVAASSSVAAMTSEAEVTTVVFATTMVTVTELSPSSLSAAASITSTSSSAALPYITIASSQKKRWAGRAHGRHGALRY